MSAIPKSAGFSFKVDGNPFKAPESPKEEQPPFDITKLPAEVQEALAKAYGTVPQQPPTGWTPSKAPDVKFDVTHADGRGTATVNWPPKAPAAPPAPPAANMPPWIAGQFGKQQQQQQATPVSVPTQQQGPQLQFKETNSGRPRVMILICSPQLVDTRFAAMMMRLPTLATVAQCEWGYIADWRYGLAETRSQLLVHAMSIPGTTHVMFLDADMIIKGDDALAIMLQDNVPFVSGIYWNTVGSGVAAWVGGNTIGLQQSAPCLPVDQVGMGCCLIQTAAIQALKDAGCPWPWFYYHVDPDKPRNFYGEDFVFQDNMSKIGVVPYVDFRVKVAHIKSTVYEWDGQTHMLDYG